MKNILLVEDTAHLAEEIGDILQMEGYNVTIASNGIHALEVLTTFEPDLIITDLLMPGMNGFEFIRRARAEQKFMSTPIIVLSAKTSDAERREAREIGANAFVPKPSKAHELLSAIRSLLSDK